MRKTFLTAVFLTAFMTLFALGAAAQHVVKGKVTDTAGETLPGVSVAILSDGPMTGTVTDADGRYSIDVKGAGQLVFSSIGYLTQTVDLQGRAVVDVVLSEDLKILDESVVVGFATQKKVNLTGSVATVGSEQLESVPVRNTVLALQGQVPGLTIKQTSGQLYNKNPNITLRGQGTIGQGSSGSVLVLIDGMEGDLYSINSQDI